MASQHQIDKVNMQIANAYSTLSNGIRAKVGANLVTKFGVSLPGYNGTASGDNNSLEFINEDGEYITKPEVIHAELNCILKAAREGVSCIDATIYITLSPCLPCAAMLKNAGIARVVYAEEYRDKEGIELLNRLGVKVERFKHD